MSSEKNNNEIMTVEQIVQSYTETFEGKMEQSLFDENIQAIKGMTAQAGITASMSVILAFLCAHVDVYTGIKHFKGTAFGPFLGIPATTGGVIMTDDESKLYRDTDTFSIVTVSAVAGGALIYFFNKKGNVLGTFVGAGFGAGEGYGAGSGKWVDA